MHKFLNEAKINQGINGFYLCKDYSIQQKTNGHEYFTLEIADKSGTCQAICWEDPKRFDVNQKSIGNIIKVNGAISSKNGEPQLRLWDVKNAMPEDNDKYDEGDII